MQKDGRVKTTLCVDPLAGESIGQLLACCLTSTKAQRFAENYHQHFRISCSAPYNHRMPVAKWIKRLGFWGFLFFLVKGLLWLLVPALVAFWATS